MNEIVPWPADAVTRMPVASLSRYAANARVHSEEQVRQIADSMREWGFTIPVLVDEKGELIAGHGRLLAAELLGLESVPAMVARGWTQKQIKAYRIADNKLALNAAWDVKLLAAELEGLKDMSALIGFNSKELRAIRAAVGGLKDPDATAPPLPTIPVTRPGDCWLLGEHRVICGDATSAQTVGALLAGARPILMVTDPPYGVNYNPAWRGDFRKNNKKKLGVVSNDDRADWREAWRLFPGDAAYVWHADRYASSVHASLEACGFNLRAQIIWAKDRHVLSRGDYHWQHEPCWYAVRATGKANWSGGRSQTTLWPIPARDDQGHGHGTQKPVECMRRPIQNNSTPGDGVYDPFVGSGTTLLAAQMEGRIAYCVDIDPGYVDVTVQRWQEFMGQEARLAVDESTFSEVAEERRANAELGQTKSAAQ